MAFCCFRIILPTNKIISPEFPFTVFCFTTNSLITFHCLKQKDVYEHIQLTGGILRLMLTVGKWAKIK